MTFGGEGVNEQIFCRCGDSPIPQVGKTLHKLCQQVFIYNEEALCKSHTSWAKVAILLLQDLSTLCVADIYGIDFHLSGFLLQQTYHIMNTFNQAQWRKKYFSRSISHQTSLNLLFYDVINLLYIYYIYYIYIYIYIYSIKWNVWWWQKLSKHEMSIVSYSLLPKIF